MIDNLSFEDVASKFEPMIKHQMTRLRIYKNYENFHQLGLIGLWEAYKEYNPARGSFQTLAITKVRGKMLDQLKKEKLYENRYIQLDVKLFDHLPDPHSEMDNVFQEEVIATYCKGLTHEQQLWVRKAITEQKKPGEIAEECNIPVERVKSWRKQAMKKIIKNIENKLVE